MNVADVDTQAILAALEKVAKDSTLRGLSGDLSALGTNKSNDPLKGPTDRLSQGMKDFGTGLANVAGDTGMSLLKFGNDVFASNARISSAATVFDDIAKSIGDQKLPKGFDLAAKGLKGVTGGALHLIKAAESGVDTFRTLSSSGASFNNDILEMKNSAAQSRLTLDEFAGIVSSNTAGFAAFGGTVTKGAQVFTAASKDMFDEGLANPLLNMGMTFQEVNEDLAEYIIRNRRRYTEAEIRDGTAAKNLVAMSTEMDKIAKLTGQNRKEMEKEVNDRMRKGQVEAKIRQLEASGNKEAADKMKLALAEAAKAGPGALAAVEDLFTKGAVVSEEGRQAAVALGPAFQDLTNMVNSAKGPGGIDGMRSSITNFNSAIAARINDPNFLQIATLGGMGNATADAAAAMVSSAGTYADNVTALMKKEGITREAAILKLDQLAKDEQKTRDPTTQTVIQGERALKDLGAIINDELIGDKGALKQFANNLKPAAEALEGLKRVDMEAPFKLMQDLVGNGQAPPSTNDPANSTVSKEQQDLLLKTLDSIKTSNGGSREASIALTNAVTALGDTDVMLGVAQSIKNQAEAQGITFEEMVKKLTDNANDVQNIKQLVTDVAKAKGLDERTSKAMGMLAAESGIQGQSLKDALANGEMIVNQLTVTGNLNVPPKAKGGPVNANSLYMVGEKGPELFSSKEAGNIINNDEFYQLLAKLGTAAKTASKGNGQIGQMMGSIQSNISGAMKGIKADQGPQQMQQMFGGLAANLEKMGTDFKQSIESSGIQNQMKDMAEQLNNSMAPVVGELMKGNKVASKQLKKTAGLAGNLFKGFG